MKKSVNGKSFDEIFAQRGVKIELAEMTKGGIYITDKTFSDWSCLFVFDSTTCRNYECWVSFMIHQRGLMASDVLIGAVTAYEATPDQIDLLNAYKNESK